MQCYYIPIRGTGITVRDNILGVPVNGTKILLYLLSLSTEIMFTNLYHYCDSEMLCSHFQFRIFELITLFIVSVVFLLVLYKKPSSSNRYP